MLWSRRAAFGLFVSTLMLACAPRGELVAADGSRRLSAVDPSSGISVVVTTGAWQGDPFYLDQEVTVLHVLVANMGSAPIRLAPGDLDLVDERGFRHQLLDTGGTFALAGQQGRGYETGRSDDFSRISVYGDVARSALPWGVLQPGTNMRGYVYFKRVDDRANAVRLLWHFHRADGAPVVDLSFDLYVARG